jgi:hypothetical protein
MEKASWRIFWVVEVQSSLVEKILEKLVVEVLGER